jgi:L-iditol 2-dehydrogenase
MKAAVWHGGADPSVETLPVPRPAEGELLVRVEACGLCPTDIKKIDLALAKPPIVLGHEMVGEVVECGHGVEPYLGKRVAVYHHVPCRRCRLCELKLFSQCAGYKKTGTTAGFAPAGGGWAEYFKVAPWIVAGGGVVELPRSLPASVAILMEPLNTCLKCVRALPGPTFAGAPPGTLVVFGLGPVGLMVAALAHIGGWKVIGVEPLPERVERALRFGACEVYQPGDDLAGRLAAAAPPCGPDAACLATDAARAVTAALAAVRFGGTVMLFGHTRRGHELAIDAGEIGVAEKRLIGSYSSSIELNDDVRALLIEHSALWRELVTHVLPLREIDQALALARHPRNGSLKIAVTPLDGGKAST